MYPIKAARDAIHLLRSRGVTFQQMADVAGVSKHTIHRYYYSRPGATTTRPEAAKAIEGLVDPRFVERFAKPEPPSLIGAQRRLRALLWMGHSHKKMRVELGFNPLNVTVAGRRSGITRDEFDAVVELYDKWSMTFGDRVVSAKAKSLGYFAPLAWDDDTIDDPRCGPHGGPPNWGPLPKGREFASLLRRRTYDEIAEMYGVTASAVRRAAERQREDLAQVS